MSKRFSMLIAALLCIGTAVCLADSPPATAVAHSSKQLSLAEFRSELQREAYAVQQLRSHPETALALHKSLPDEFIIAANTQSYPLDTAPLKKALGEFIIAVPERKTQLLSSMDARLSSMSEALEQYSSPADFSSERGNLYQCSCSPGISPRQGHRRCSRDGGTRLSPPSFNSWNDCSGTFLLQWTATVCLPGTLSSPLRSAS